MARQGGSWHGGVRYHSMKGAGFSLWIVPEGDVRRRLAALIAELARRFGGPVFDPHVTLLAGLPGPAESVIARAEEVMRVSNPFPVRFVGPELGDGYFRSLYLRVEPGSEAARRAASALLATGMRGMAGAWRASHCAHCASDCACE